MEKSFYKYEIEPDKFWINQNYIIQLNITGECPLNCDFCYIKKNYSNIFLSLKKLQKLWENLRKYHELYGITYTVNLTGGDIFYHPKLSEILKFIYNEPSIKLVEPLINRFWKNENRQTLSILKDKVTRIQFNSDVVLDRDIEYAKAISKEVILKVSIYSGKCKNNLKKIQSILRKFENVSICTDLIIPQKNSKINEEDFVLNNPLKMKKLVQKFKNSFGERFRLTSTTGNRIVGGERYLCPVPLGGLCVMPDGRIVSCAKYPHLSSGFNISNFDLEEYIIKYNKLCSNFCLFENKYFTDFWKESENPLNFRRKT